MSTTARSMNWSVPWPGARTVSRQRAATIAASASASRACAVRCCCASSVAGVVATVGPSAQGGLHERAGLHLVLDLLPTPQRLLRVLLRPAGDPAPEHLERDAAILRSEEHTSELQSRGHP